MKHYSVMLLETLDLLSIKPDGIYVDGTLGRGGHSCEILKRLDQGHLYCFDLDLQAIADSKQRLDGVGSNYTCIHANFADMKECLAKLNVLQVDGILLDLGVSSPQFDESTRGFSYRSDAKLDMRMNQEDSLTAYDVVNQYSFQDLYRILTVYGQEKFAKHIARAIENYRKKKPIETTFELVDIVKSVLPAKVLSSKGHPCKQTFQAIRIEVNQELESLKKFLNELDGLLKEHGRCAIITFHSLEDRLVKEKFQALSSVKQVDKRIPLLPNQIEEANFRLLNKKVIVATQEELEENKRSKPAKLRGIERLR